MLVPNLEGEKELKEKTGQKGRRKESKNHTDWEMLMYEHEDSDGA